MSRATRMIVRFMVIGATIAAVAVVFAPPSRTSSPYLSALSDLTASPAFAAKKNCRGMCEFASPGYVCTESVNTQCTHPATGGCVTQAC